MHPLLKPIFNRGGIGRSMSREESVDVFNPLIRQHHRLLHAYDAALRTLGDRTLADRVNGEMNRARTELAKLKETVFSLGGDAPNGTDLDPDVDLGRTDADILHALDDRERAYRDALEDVLARTDLQLHSTAILKNNLKGSKARLDMLHPAVTRMRRPDSHAGRRPARPVPVDDVTGTPKDVAPDERHATMLERGNIQNAD